MRGDATGGDGEVRAGRARRAPWTALWLVVVGLGVVAAGARAPLAGGPLVLIGIDGFRHDYLDLADVPVLRELAADGVRADGLIPPFPSKTFPSFTTIVTGLWPVHHGIVANTMDDPGIGTRFSLADHEGRSDPRWWRAEPIWNTAERQGVRTASMFWPGDDVAIGGGRPGAWQMFDDAFPHEGRVDRVLEWLARPAAERPGLVTLYFSLVDTAAHDHGPTSPQALGAASAADALVGRLMAGLRRLGLERTANLIVVSDHGLAETRLERVVLLDDYVDLASVDVLETGPMLRLAPRVGGSADTLVTALAGIRPHVRVYRGDALPAHYRAQGSSRLPPVIGVADEGWLVLTRAQRDRWRDRGGGPMGEHGYDPAVQAMHGVFVAHGPAFRAGTRVGPFESVHLYALFCRLLGLAPRPNDGDASVTARFIR